jgi:hypothetical protein
MIVAFQEDYEAGLNQLAGHLGLQVAPPEAEGIEKPQPSGRRSGRLLLALAALLALVIGMVVFVSGLVDGPGGRIPTPASTPVIVVVTATLLPATDTPTPTTGTTSTRRPTIAPTRTATPRLTDTATPQPPTNTPALITREFKVKAETDDAEEIIHNGSIYISSSDLELFVDQDPSRDAQLVGIRFSDVTIPKGAKIVKAYIEFQAKDQVESWERSLLGQQVTLTVQGEIFNNGRPFAQPFDADETNNISNRARTNASYEWIPDAWEEGEPDQTGNLNQIIQEIVDHPEWPSEPPQDQAMVFIISGRHDSAERGVRIAKSRENGEQSAPILHVEYQLP